MESRNNRVRGSIQLTTCLTAAPTVKVFLENEELGEVRLKQEHPFLMKGQRAHQAVYEVMTAKQQHIGTFQPHFMNLAKGYELVLPTYGTILDTTTLVEGYCASIRGTTYEVRRGQRGFEYVIDDCVRMIVEVAQVIQITPLEEVSDEEQLIVAMLAMKLAAA